MLSGIEPSETAFPGANAEIVSQVVESVSGSHVACGRTTLGSSQCQRANTSHQSLEGRTLSERRDTGDDGGVENASVEIEADDV